MAEAKQREKGVIELLFELALGESKLKELFPNPEDLTVSDSLGLEPEQQVDLFIEATKKKNALDAMLKQISLLRDTLNNPIAVHFAEQSQQRVNRRGMTVSLKREEYPKVLGADIPEDANEETIALLMEEAKQGLIEALSNNPEYQHLVRSSYNHQTLRSWMTKELPRDEDGKIQIPEDLEGKLGVSEEIKVVATKG